jgi:hypothetical protein
MLTLKSVLTFGKYKGKTLRHVLYEQGDFGYLIWLHDKTEHKLHPNTRRTVDEHQDMYNDARAEAWYPPEDLI